VSGPTGNCRSPPAWAGEAGPTRTDAVATAVRPETKVFFSHRRRSQDAAADDDDGRSVTLGVPGVDGGTAPCVVDLEW
jgi:hypothetical protein